MSRAYRPRLSKDKAVAQRVGAELERERLQDFSVAKQMAALGVLDSSSKTPIDTTCNSSSSPTTPSTATPRTPAPPTAPEAQASCIRARNLGSPSLGTSSADVTPVSTRRSRSKQRSLNRSTTTSPAEGRPAAAAAAAATGPRPAPHTPKEDACDLASRRPSSCDKGDGNRWPCVSCSFLNVETAKKCRMCNTKHKRAPIRAEGVVGMRETTARDPQRRRSGTQERDSYRGVDDYDAGPPTSRRGVTRVGSRDENVDEDADTDAGGAAVFLAALGGRGVDERTPRRNGVGRGTTSAGAADALSTDAAAVAAAPQRRRNRSDGVPATARTGEGEISGEGCIVEMPPSSRKRGRKRARAPASAAAASPSRPAGNLPEEPTSSMYLSTIPSVDASPSPPGMSCKATYLPLPPPKPREKYDDVHVSQPTPLEGALKDQSQHLSPFVVTPMANGDGGEDELEDTPRRRLATTTIVSAARPAGGTSTPLSGSASTTECSWPTVARVASLDFGDGGRAWEVSSVAVTAGLRRSGAEKSSVEGCATAAVVVVCHSGGVSVWSLTDTEAVCTHVSPALAGVTTEGVRGRMHVAAVVGREVSEVLPSAIGTPGGVETCIVAVGRHDADPGLPIIRVWQGSLRNFGDVGRGGAFRENPATPPKVLTTTLKKKFSKYFPPVVPRSVTPCLCVCGFSATERRGAAMGQAEEKGDSGQITAVMALGGKAVRLVCVAGRNGSDDVRGKALPTGAVDIKAVCTSLAPVPSNPFLVWASFPSSNAILLWDVRELQLLFALPLTSSSICSPVHVSPFRASSTGRDGTSSAPAEGTTSCEHLSSTPTRRRQSSGERRDPRLLCLLATEGRDNYDGGAPTRLGCGLIGVYCARDDDGERTRSCRGACGNISAVLLEIDGKSPLPSSAGKDKGGGGREDDKTEAYLGCLSDGNGFVAGVDRRGKVVARNVSTGESRVLLATETPGGANFACMDFNSGILALATGGVGCAAATSIDLFALSDAGGDVPVAVGVSA